VGLQGMPGTGKTNTSKVHFNIHAFVRNEVFLRNDSNLSCFFKYLMKWSLLIRSLRYMIQLVHSLRLNYLIKFINSLVVVECLNVYYYCF